MLHFEPDVLERTKRQQLIDGLCSDDDHNSGFLVNESKRSLTMGLQHKPQCWKLLITLPGYTQVLTYAHARRMSSEVLSNISTDYYPVGLVRLGECLSRSSLLHYNSCRIHSPSSLCSHSCLSFSICSHTLPPCAMNASTSPDLASTAAGFLPTPDAPFHQS